MDDSTSLRQHHSVTLSGAVTDKAWHGMSRPRTRKNYRALPAVRPAGGVGRLQSCFGRFPRGEGRDSCPSIVRAFLIGMIVGLRSLTAPAVVSREAHLGWLLLENTGLRFLGDGARPTS